MNIMEVKFFIEDYYGDPFLTEIIRKLEELNLIGNIIIKKFIRLPVLCNYKLDRQLIANDKTCDKILIILDSDGPHNYKERFVNVKGHIPKEIETPVEIILLEYEIEEWICISMELKWHSKPSEELKRKLGYKKSDLPNYANKLDFKKLINKSKSFIKFVKALK